MNILKIKMAYVRDTSSIVVDVAPFRPQIQRAIVKEVLTETIGRQGGPDMQDTIADVTWHHQIQRCIYLVL